jgi:hypothetical protein
MTADSESRPRRRPRSIGVRERHSTGARPSHAVAAPQRHARKLVSSENAENVPAIAPSPDPADRDRVMAALT